MSILIISIAIYFIVRLIINYEKMKNHKINLYSISIPIFLVYGVVFPLIWNLVKFAESIAKRSLFKMYKLEERIKELEIINTNET